MRRLVVLCALITCTATSPPADEPGYDWQAGPDVGEVTRSLEENEKICRDRIHTVRGERGLPTIDDGTAPADEPLLIAAVDHRIGECSVMVMKHDTRDVRPIPKPDESAPLLRRIQ